MSHIDQGPLSSYNSLNDPNLAGYFKNTRMKRHLKKAGLVNKYGEIITESTYRLNMARKEHKKHVRDLLAQAIVHKTLDLERNRQTHIKKKIEEIAKIENVRRVKADRGRQGDEDILPYLVPKEKKSKKTRPSSVPSEQVGRPPTSGSQEGLRPVSAPAKRRDQSGYKDKYENTPMRSIYVDEDGYPVHPRDVEARRHQRREPEGWSENRSPGRQRARSKSHQEAWLSEEEEDSSAASTDRSDVREGRTSYRSSEISDRPAEKSERRRRKDQEEESPYPKEEIDTRHLYALDQTALREYTMNQDTIENGRGRPSPYLYPQPLEPAPPKESPRRKGRARARLRVQGTEKTPKSNKGSLMLHREGPALHHEERVQSLCEVTMTYHGSKLRLEREIFDPRHEVMVEQQHCGGNTLIVFRELILPGSDFTFVSRRHRGYPFSLTFYINGTLDSRLSVCCEYKHRAKARLGGKHGHFGILSITGAAPCYKCQVAQQLKEREKEKKRRQKEAQKNKPKPEGEGEIEPEPEQETIIEGKRDEYYREPEHGEQSQGITIAVEDDSEKEDENYDDDFENEDEDGAIISVIPDDDDDKQEKVTRNDDEEEEIKEEEEEENVVVRGYPDDDEEAETIGEESNKDDDEDDKRSIHSDRSAESNQSAESVRSDQSDRTNRSAPQSVKSERSEKSARKSEADSDETAIHSIKSVNRDASDNEKEEEREEKEDEVLEGTEHEYEVRVTTGKNLLSETDAGVFITLHGRDGSSEETELKIDGEDCFERGETNSFKLKIKKNIGPITKIRIGHDDKGFASGWLLEKVVVREKDGDKSEWTFECHSWLTESTDGALKWRELEPLERSDDGSVQGATIPSTAASQEKPASDEEKRDWEPEPSDSSSSSSSEDERENTARSTAPDSEAENQDGGNDPDNVADEETLNSTQLSTIGVTPGEAHSGSIRPLVAGKTDLDLTSVSLSADQVSELSEVVQERSDIGSLVLRNADINDEGMRKLAMSLTSTASELKMLNLNLNKITPEGAVHVMDIIQHKKNIEMLLLHGNPLGDKGVSLVVDSLLDIHHQRSKVGNRKLSNASTTSSEIAAIDSIAKQMSVKVIDQALRSDSPLQLGNEERVKEGSGLCLTHLDLGDCKFGDAGAKKVAKLIKRNTHLASLILIANKDIGMEGWMAIGEALKWNSHITTLSLDYNDIDDAAISALAEGLSANRSIQSLDLEGNDISDAGARMLLDAIQNNFAMRDVTLTPGNKISNELLSEIRNNLIGRTS